MPKNSTKPLVFRGKTTLWLDEDGKANVGLSGGHMTKGTRLSTSLTSAAGLQIAHQITMQRLDVLAQRLESYGIAVQVSHGPTTFSWEHGKVDVVIGDGRMSLHAHGVQVDPRALNIVADAVRQLPGILRTEVEFFVPSAQPSALEVATALLFESNKIWLEFIGEDPRLVLTTSTGAQHPFEVRSLGSQVALVTYGYPDGTHVEDLRVEAQPLREMGLQAPLIWVLHGSSPEQRTRLIDRFVNKPSVRLVFTEDSGPAHVLTHGKLITAPFSNRRAVVMDLISREGETEPASSAQIDLLNQTLALAGVQDTETDVEDRTHKHRSIPARAVLKGDVLWWTNKAGQGMEAEVADAHLNLPEKGSGGGMRLLIRPAFEQPTYWYLGFEDAVHLVRRSEV